jgi:hypothetical protein
VFAEQVDLFGFDDLNAVLGFDLGKGGWVHCGIYPTIGRMAKRVFVNEC